MSEVIASTVQLTRIVEHIRRTDRMARARAGEIAAAAQARLAPAIAEIDAALAALGPATEAEAEAWAVVVSEDSSSDVLIGGRRDVMWTALGRPGRSQYMARVFPGGIGTYTHGDPRRQPTMMSLLEQRILSCAAPSWSEEQRKEWAGEIAKARQSLEAALDKHRPTEGAALVAKAAYRTAVQMGHESLRAFKRDLQSLGLSKAQIFDIIPDGTPTPATPPKTEGISNPTGTTGNTSQKAA